MALEAYRKKRDFAATPEPAGKAAPKRRRAAPRFVVQMHAARRLHYDLRLEEDGVLWSWAVTRGPSLVPGEKRLAVRTEDHPLDYATFEGTIPKGEYGGGTVLVWDTGSWKPIGDAAKGAAKGHLEFELRGKRLKGRWHLVRMAKKPREKRENWLLIKGEDRHARTEADPDVLEEHATSVLTGRSVEEVAGEPPGWSSKSGRLAPAPPPAPGAVAAAFPDFLPVALAALKPAPPAGTRWVHEIKFDGYRLQVHLRDGAVRLFTRSGLDWTDRFGDRLAAAFAALPAEAAVIDGEVVVENAAGASDFSELQADLSAGRHDRFVFYAFDLLHLDGHDLRPAGCLERKAALETLLAGADEPLRFSAHLEEEGEVVLRHSCRLSLEGIVSKRRDAPYRGGRTGDWVKSKCRQRQEFVILGYLPATTRRKAVGALLLGHHAGGELVPVGRVGTGFTERTAAELFARLEPLRVARSPVAARLDAAGRRGVVFVAPELVAEVEYRAWTAGGTLRHAVFRGLREDKPAAEVVAEDRAAAAGAPADRPAPAVKLTHPDRLYWPDAGVTKEGLADYYAEVWPRMAPHVVNRPLALLRCPDGAPYAGGSCFFQKHAWRGMSREILRRDDPADDGADASFLAIDGLPGLLGLVQGGTLEIHAWQAPADDLERPDQIVMDLDPGEGVGWAEVAAAAREVRDRLAAAGLAGFLKTSGGKGLHVVAPLRPKAGWAEVKAFAKRLADGMAADAPDRFVATITKSKRRGRILVDYLRNGRGATAVAAYSTRARAGATVSMPLGWDELDEGARPELFTVASAPARVAAVQDPWEGFRKAAAPLGKGRRRRAA